jgi:hypothetical protein
MTLGSNSPLESIIDLYPPSGLEHANKSGLVRRDVVFCFIELALFAFNSFKYALIVLMLLASRDFRVNQFHHEAAFTE